MLKIKNEDLVDVMSFLKGFNLPPKISRIRTKLAKLIQVKIDDLYQDEVDLLQKYGNQQINCVLKSKPTSIKITSLALFSISFYLTKRNNCSAKTDGSRKI